MFTNFALPPSGSAALFSSLQALLAGGLLVVLVIYFNGLGLLATVLDILKENTPRR